MSVGDARGSTEQAVVPRVVNVVNEVLEGSLVGHNSLRKIPKHGNHRQTAVVNFLGT